MKKEDRQKIFDKYGGRCAYCGCELLKGWHVDEIEPVRRKWKWVNAHWENKLTGETVSDKEVNNYAEGEIFHRFKWVEDRKVQNGYSHPENLNINNQNPACASCNINKRSDTLEQFRNNIMGYMKHLNELSTQYKIAKRYGLIIEPDKQVVFYFETLKQTA